MDISKSLITELQYESAKTRRMLERVPTDKLDWRPHETSMTVEELAGLVSEMPYWIDSIVNTDELDFAKTPPLPFKFKTTEELLKHHDDAIAKALAALEKLNEENMNKNWTLRNGDHILAQQPKIVMIRDMVLNHLYHHRGQLSVFYRIMGVPVPALYGPSRDEK